jgi:hypothetical protein
MNWITKAKYKDSYKVWLKFNDGTEGIVDLGSTIMNDHREIFRELRDKEQFRKFKVDADTIVWENGLDLAPEFLYEMAVMDEKKG